MDFKWYMPCHALETSRTCHIGGFLRFIAPPSVICHHQPLPPLSLFQRVNAEMAIFTAGYVILTLIINAPLCAPLMTVLKLDRISEEQLQMRRHVRGGVNLKLGV